MFKIQLNTTSKWILIVFWLLMFISMWYFFHIIHFSYPIAFLMTFLITLLYCIITLTFWTIKQTRQIMNIKPNKDYYFVYILTNISIFFPILIWTLIIYLHQLKDIQTAFYWILFCSLFYFIFSLLFLIISYILKCVIHKYEKTSNPFLKMQNDINNNLCFINFKIAIILLFFAFFWIYFEALWFHLLKNILQII